MTPHDATPSTEPIAPDLPPGSVRVRCSPGALSRLLQPLARPVTTATHRVGANTSLRSRPLQLLLLLLALTLPLFCLFPSSFAGKTILLPLDLLAVPGVYLSATNDGAQVRPGNFVFADQVLEYEMNRRFVAKELRAGRLPLWNPYGYAGAPFANFHKYSPFMWPYYLVDSPYSLPWIQLLVALVAGGGAFFFFRRVLAASYLAAAMGAAAFPLVGYFVLWRGYSLTYAAAWLPWLLFFVERTVRRPRSAAPIALAVVTCLTLVSGQVDVSGQALLASAVFALGRLLTRWRGTPRRTQLASVGALAGAWMLGLILAAPYLFPLIEYAQTGVRYEARVAGHEERPPIGLRALPAMLLPDAYGSSADDSFYIEDLNQLEGPASGYAGLLATLLLAPLAFRRRGRGSLDDPDSGGVDPECSRRGLVPLLLVLLLLAAGWNLAIPGVVQLLRLPLLDIMSHNRFVFVSAFAVLALAVLGLERLREGRKLSRLWLLGLLPSVAFGIWCVHSFLHLPEPIATQLGTVLGAGSPPGVDPERITRIQAAFRFAYARGLLLCLVTASAWALIVLAPPRRGWIRLLLGGALLAELLWFAADSTRESDPSLYYPSLPALETLRGTSQRTLGLACLPANLNECYELRDVRGYDGVDPAPIVELLELARDPRSQAESYNRLQWYAPPVQVTQDGNLVLPPILDMLGVRHVVVRGAPPANVRATAVDGSYWVGENPRALPRAFVPQSVIALPAGQPTLARLGRPDFDPRAVAFVELPPASPTGLGPREGRPRSEAASIIPVPPTWHDAMEAGDAIVADGVRGVCTIIRDEPSTVVITAELAVAGLVVLADSWDPGWRATVNGNEAAVLRANHGIRAVAAPAGRSEIRFTYQPQSFSRGVALLAIGLLALVFWSFGLRRQGPLPTAERKTGPDLPVAAAVRLQAPRPSARALR